MITDDIATITPDKRQLDGELRNLAAAIEALDVLRYYLAGVARARQVRGAGHEDLELAQDESIEMQRGLQRAYARRKRDLGAFLREHGARP